MPDTLNKCILRIVDTSVYDTDIPVNCPTLQVTVPGYIHPVNFTNPEINTGFILNLTACDLDIQTTQCGTTFYDVPDGIYIIKYSVSPNELVYVEYNHLRITSALNKVKDIYCELDLGACEPPSDILKKLNQIRIIEQYLKAAKAYVEDCHDAKKGMELYAYAVKQLDKMFCGTGCRK